MYTETCVATMVNRDVPKLLPHCSHVVKITRSAEVLPDEYIREVFSSTQYSSRT